jgi:hypothetical protein
MSSTQTAAAPTPLPCAACKQPVIEKRTADGALVVLDAATKRLHLCVKRKEVEAAKAKQIAASRARPERPPTPRPPAKRVEASRPPDASRPARPSKPPKERASRPARPVRAKAAEAPQKASRAKRRKMTLRSREQVEEILKGRVVRWRTGDGPTSFCDTCGAPVLVGFSHVRWDVMMLDAAGHRPHDCEATRLAAAALRAQPVNRIDVPELPDVESTRRPSRPLAPVAPVAPSIKVEAKPRRRPAERKTPVAANTCETCGNLKALVNGEWVCLHCGA